MVARNMMRATRSRFPAFFALSSKHFAASRTPPMSAKSMTLKTSPRDRSMPVHVMPRISVDAHLDNVCETAQALGA